jgi:hypothetical protein
MKITVFWDMTSCSLVKVYRRFERTYCLFPFSAYCSTLKMEAICSAEILVNFHQTTLHHIPEDSTFRKLLNSYQFLMHIRQIHRQTKTILIIHWDILSRNLIGKAAPVLTSAQRHQIVWGSGSMDSVGHTASLATVDRSLSLPGIKT